MRMTGANLHKIIEALRRAGVTIEDDGVRLIGKAKR